MGGACTSCCQHALRDIIRGISILTALGGLGPLLYGLHCLTPLGPAATMDLSISWFSVTLCGFGTVMVVLGMATALGACCKLQAPLHLYTGATLVLLPLEALLVWAYAAHSSQLRWLAVRDQTYAATAILDWVDGNVQLAAWAAAFFLLLQAMAVLLGSVYACCPTAPRQGKHPWDHYWEGEEGREPLLPQGGQGQAAPPATSGSGSPRATGYHTPPSRFQSPYHSPGRPLPTTGPFATAPPLPVTSMA